jgi:hypothetical protein
MAMESEPQIKPIVEQLETYYEMRGNPAGGETSKLSPEIEHFLRDDTRRFGQQGS